MLDKLKQWAKDLKIMISAIAISLKDSRTPWYAKVIGGLVVLYAISPIDLIPDFIPVLGFLDDVILLPVGIYLTLKLIPQKVIVENKQKAKTIAPSKQQKLAGLLFIFLIWFLLICLLWRVIFS
ncbi:YkvA family protein [Pseudalkalibacillus caeni]|uniref:DUF1232 domain-containing protein n=1 Tax=Exobacillus caeni TaxID=2574798 RepID=A0A5R9F6E6_9BACL|nr:YkvA family protein [Pseudalkalibacillus caeni]TLS37926.1 DUF1232 domain-containing protein [Pseudalkalibacillus caeni]